MVDFVIIGIVILILGGAVAYIVKAKKKGAKCIGCPAGGMCSGNCSENCAESCAGNDNGPCLNHVEE